jgi:phage tail-like protein
VAHSLREQRASYPLAAYNFRVTIDGEAMRFAKVSGLQREHQVVTYRHGLTFAEGEQIAKFRHERFVSITLEQGTVTGHAFLYRWLETHDPCAMEVSLCDEHGAPVVAWNIARAVPVKLTAAALDAASNQVSIDSLEVRAAGISVKHLV